MSCQDQEFSTPLKASNPFEDLNPRGSRKRKQIDFTSKLVKDNIQSQQASASPLLKKPKDMPACRSPNPIKKATLSLQAPADSAMDTDQVQQPSNALSIPAGPPGNTAPVAVLGSAPALIDPEFLTKMDKKMDLLTAGMMSISSRVDEQGKLIGENSALIASQADAIAKNANNIADIFRKLETLKTGFDKAPVQAPPTAPARPEPSRQFKWARRSIRLWPVPSSNENEMWEGVGDFLQDRLLLNSDRMSQDDIEAIAAVDNPGAGAVKDEVVVTFHSPDTRDTVLMSAKHLGGEVDVAGLPLAGVRLEIPPELTDTFRLLNRFGARLRARHGEGTKRHIRFDDYRASLYSIIKLPGDSEWTRVSPQMARRDLDASLREEESANEKRLAAKLLPGPRERLRRPVPTQGSGTNPGGPSSTAAQRPRPKWGAPVRPGT